MNILGINGSPRRGGNTEILLDMALQGVASVKGAAFKKVVLNELDIKPCQDCGGCGKTGVCVIKDDMAWLAKDLMTTDGVIIASPIFFGSISAQVKIMIDRLQAPWVSKYVLKKTNPDKKTRPGAFLAVGAFKSERFFKNAKEIIKIAFTVLDIDYKYDFFCPGVDRKEGILKKNLCLSGSYRLGVRIAGG